MQHWLPYDETRLYRLLGVDRGDVWRWLRDDTRPLAELARQQGWDPEELAKALVAPWKGKLNKPAQLAVLQERALKTLTQGHMSQHMFFHSLHQEAIPSHATKIFGVASRIEWSSLRRSEMSPLEICRLNGISRSARAEGGRGTAAARRRVGRAPPDDPGGAGPAPARPPAPPAPALAAADPLQRPAAAGPRASRPPRRRTTPTTRRCPGPAARSRFESYEAKLTIAKTRGEIAVMARGPGAAPPALASAAAGLPSSNYNPAMSADGRWVAFESAEGNLNFAKRYGEMNVFVRDLERGRIVNVSNPLGGQVSRSRVQPDDLRRRPARRLRDLRAGRGIRHRQPRRRPRRPHGPGRGSSVRRRGPGDASEPQLSRDGRRLAFTSLVGEQLGGVRPGSRAAGARGSRSRAADEAWEPSLSADGSASRTRPRAPARTSHVVVRDLRSDRATTIASPAGRGLAYEPSLSGDGPRVAFVARPLGLRRTQVWVTDLRTSLTQLVSRGDGPGGAPGRAARPTRRSPATAVAWRSRPTRGASRPRSATRARGVFVRDLARARTRLVSVGDGANRYVGPDARLEHERRRLHPDAVRVSRPVAAALAVIVLLGGGLRAAEAASPHLADESADERFYAVLARGIALASALRRPLAGPAPPVPRRPRRAGRLRARLSPHPRAARRADATSRPRTGCRRCSGRCWWSPRSLLARVLAGDVARAGRRRHSSPSTRRWCARRASC